MDSEFNILCLANLRESDEAFVVAGSNRKDQAQFQNCVNPNLMSDNHDTLVLETLYPLQVENNKVINISSIFVFISFNIEK